MKNKTLIAALRKQKGWTQEILAEKCNLSVRTIQRLESGEDGNISTLNVIAQALDVKIGDLFDSIANHDKEQEITNYDELQQNQVTQRRSAHKLYVIAKIIFGLTMICLTSFIQTGLLWIFWLFMWPIGFIIFSVVNTIWLQPKLDTKYPLTKGIDLKTYKEAHQSVEGD